VGFPQLPLATFSITPGSFDEVQYLATDGVSFTDLTYLANAYEAEAFSTLTTTGASADYLYFAKFSTFNTISIAVSTRAVGTDLTLEISYWNGSSWVEINTQSNALSDGTLNLTRLGTITWDRSTMSDWVTGHFAGYTEDYYWVRMRYSAGTITTVPVMSLVKSHPSAVIASYAGPFDVVPSFSVSGVGRGVFGINTKSYPSSFPTGVPKVIIVQEDGLRPGLYIDGAINQPGNLAEFKDNAATDGAILAYDGALSFIGTARKLKSVQKNAYADGVGYAVTISGNAYAAAVSATLGPIYFHTLRNSVTGTDVGDAVAFQWVTPSDRVSESNIKIRVYWMPADNVGGNVVLVSGERHTVAGSSYVQATTAGSTATVAAGTTQYGLNITDLTITGTGIGVKCPIELIVARNGESGSDTYANDIYVSDIEILYLSDRFGE